MPIRPQILNAEDVDYKEHDVVFSEIRNGDIRNEYLYAGEQYNAETGRYYNRARYMEPTTGTFISMDSYFRRL